MTYSMGFRLIILIASVAFIWPIDQAKANYPVQWNGYLTAQGLDGLCSPKVNEDALSIACTMYLMGTIDNDRFRATGTSEKAGFCIPERMRIDEVKQNISAQLHALLSSKGPNLPLKDGAEVPQLATVMVRFLMIKHYPCPVDNQVE